MAITHVSSSGIFASATNITVTYPATISAGNLLLLFVSNKYPTNGPSTPSGFTLLGQAQGGAGSAGNDSGNVYSTVFYKIASGSESGNFTLTIPSNNVGCCFMWNLSKGSGETWDLSFATGSDNSAGTSWSTTASSDLKFHRGDFAIVCNAINSDNYTWTLDGLSATGATFSFLSRSNNGTALGQDCAILIPRWSVTSGPSTAAAVNTATADTSAANSPAGASVFIRVTAKYPASTFSGVGTFSPTLTKISSINLATTMAGVGTLTGVLTKTVTHSLSVSMNGSSGLAPQRSSYCRFDGIGTLTGVLSLAGILPATTFPGVGTFSIQRSMFRVGFDGAGNLTVTTPTITHARSAAFAGEGTFIANMTLNDTSLEVTLPGSYHYIRNYLNRWR